MKRPRICKGCDGEIDSECSWETGQMELCFTCYEVAVGDYVDKEARKRLKQRGFVVQPPTYKYGEK